MSGSGFEWPPPDGKRCGRAAEDQNGKFYGCMLRRGHSSETCHWQKTVGDQLLSVSWIATGPTTFVGGRDRGKS